MFIPRSYICIYVPERHFHKTIAMIDHNHLSICTKRYADRGGHGMNRQTNGGHTGRWTPRQGMDRQKGGLKDRGMN